MGDGVRLVDLQQVTWGTNTHEHPVFSPDGKTLAYYAGVYGWLQIYVSRDDGTGERPITCGRGNHTQADFSHDGKHLYFRAQASNEAPWALVRVAVDDPDDRVVLLQDRKVSFKHPSESPDGKWLAWFADAGTPGNFHLFKAKLTSKGLAKPVRLTDDRNRNDCHPTWSPDGKWILFHAYLGATDAAESHIFVCDAEGGAVRRLTTEPAFHKHPFFVGPDLVVHHTEALAGGGRHLVLRRVKDGAVCGTLTSGKHNDKHPCPFVPTRGPVRIAFASKKRGVELAPGLEPNYDIFWGLLDGVPVRRT